MAHNGKLIQNPKTGQDILFVQTSKETNGRLLEMEASWRPGSLPPALHYHPVQEEDFMVISGEITVRIGGSVKVLKQGDSLHIPPRTPHAMWNNSNSKTIVNWKVRPAMNTEYLLETGVGLAKDGKLNRPTILQMALIANKYDRVFRLAKPPFIIQKLIFIILTPLALLCGYRAVYKKYID